MNEDGIDSKLADSDVSQEMPARRRLFEGGSGVVPSSLNHKASLDLRMEASSVREQAGSLSSRAILEGMRDHHEEGIREESEASDDDRQYSQVSSTQDDDPEYLHNQYTDQIGGSNAPYSDRRSSIVSSRSRSLSLVSPSSTGNKDRITVEKLLSFIPSVLLGSLLNILDGLSYGMILFPLGTAVFGGLESVGLAMFYTSTIVAQLVFSFGASSFKSCVGSEMIEVVPFFHAMALRISTNLADSPREEILATTVASFSVSCIFTGLIFFLLGWLKLGTLVGFFPLHVLLGCIGGVGWFLVATGVEVALQNNGGLTYDLRTILSLFGDWGLIARWGSCLALGSGLMFAERRLHHPLIVPATLIVVFFAFHFVVAVVPGLSLDMARNAGWVFPAQSSGEPWYWVYTLYRPSLIHIGPMIENLPVMFAVAFFGIIHVPINIPALAAAIKEDTINVNQELVAHGISNTLSGCLGSIQNYLVYTNSVMFIKSGAESHVAGIMLAIATTIIMIIGPGIIGYIPVIVVASLIFMMGFDLLAEALVDTYGSVRKQDYATIMAITLIMGCFDFVFGVLAGIVLACLFFVINSARMSPVTESTTGEHAHSTVIRPVVLQQFLHKVGQQIHIMRLTGALFFGTNWRLEREVRLLSDHNSHDGRSTIKYLILDLEHVTDIDYCTVDTFLRLKRLLDTCKIRLILSGAETAGHKIRGLKAVDLVPERVDWKDPYSVRVFPTLNIALGWCENQFIKDYYQHREQWAGRRVAAERILAPPPKLNWGSSGSQSPSGSPFSPAAIGGASVLGTTPRTSHLREVADTAAYEDLQTATRWYRHKQPMALLLQIVGFASNKGDDFWSRLVPFLQKQELKTGDTVHAGLHLIESGILHIQYDSGYFETALTGTAVGDFNSGGRKCHIHAEMDSVIYTLTNAKLKQLRNVEGGSELAAELLLVYVEISSERYNRLTDYYRIAD